MLSAFKLDFNQDFHDILKMAINFNYLLFSGSSTKTWYPRFQSIPAITNITVVVDLVGIRELVAHQVNNFVPTFYFVSTLGILALFFVVNKAKTVCTAKWQNITSSKKFFYHQDIIVETTMTNASKKLQHKPTLR